MFDGEVRPERLAAILIALSEIMLPLLAPFYLITVG